MKSITTTLVLSLITLNAFAEKMDCLEQFYRVADSKYQIENEKVTNAIFAGTTSAIMTSSSAAGYMYTKSLFPSQDLASSLVTGASTTGGFGTFVVGGPVGAVIQSDTQEAFTLGRLAADASIGEGQELDTFVRSVLFFSKDVRDVKHPADYAAKKAIIEILNERPELCAASSPRIARQQVLDASVSLYKKIQEK